MPKVSDEEYAKIMADREWWERVPKPGYVLTGFTDRIEATFGVVEERDGEKILVYTIPLHRDQMRLLGHPMAEDDDNA